MNTLAVPGQTLGSLSTHTPSSNTHVYKNNIIASKPGTITTTATSKPSISVASPATSLPELNSIVLLRVLRVQRLSASCAVLSVLTTSSTNLITIPTLVNDDLQPQATLRREDVRAYEKDKVVMNDSFRAGDIVKAFVISLGDERTYFVSTAGDEFGVLVAKSEDGGYLSAVSWKEMRDARTGKVELRKVAKPT